MQHSHGYLSTLRGAVLLHEITGDAAMLAFAERLYGELVRSSDYTVDGGVLEYFGWGDPTNAASLAAAKAASGVFPRNEGCGLADFVRLSLQLHRATGRVEYLERAERCLVNGFAHNQFANGDFGSRVFFDQGIQPSPSVTARGGAAPCTATGPSATCSTTPSSRRTARWRSSSSRTWTSTGRRRACACGARRSG